MINNLTMSIFHYSREVNKGFVRIENRKLFHGIPEKATREQLVILYGRLYSYYYNCYAETREQLLLKCETLIFKLSSIEQLEKILVDTEIMYKSMKSTKDIQQYNIIAVKKIRDSIKKLIKRRKPIERRERREKRALSITSTVIPITTSSGSNTSQVSRKEIDRVSKATNDIYSTSSDILRYREVIHQRKKDKNSKKEEWTANKRKRTVRINQDRSYKTREIHVSSKDIDNYES